MRNETIMKPQRILRLLPLLLLALPVVVQAQFTFTTNGDNTITITGYTGPAGDVAIPSKTNGLPITCIGEWAFYGTSPSQPTFDGRA